MLEFFIKKFHSHRNSSEMRICTGETVSNIYIEESDGESMIADPYKVLGLEQDASPDDIKKAYRHMAKINHPDLHPDDPNAVQKMNEINEAYDMLTNPEKYAVRRAREEAEKQQQEGGAGVVQETVATEYQGVARPRVKEGDSPEIQQAIDYINQNLDQRAQHVLTFIPSADRDARWYYLSALAYYVAADFVQAADQMTKACQMDTKNQEYQHLLWYFQQTGQNYEKKPKNFLITPLIPIAGILGYILGKLFLGN